ncbi:MAG: hypothetical protein GY786_04470, partial [Proteobacteria bacterium]|nr:hypothetical protein [Pseudomonadota bacterium]
QVQKNDDFSVDRDSNDTYELEVNGTAVATGRIVKKRGEYYFKVTGMDEEEIK